MNRKSFILLAAPSMVGKTSAANHIGEKYPDIKIVRNDDLLNELFDLAMFPRQEDISKDEVWLPQVSAKVDFMGLTRLLHKNIILENSGNSVFLAEGYMYMLAHYSDQVRLCMQNLDFKIEFFLLKYEPTIEVQLRRQKMRFAEFGWCEDDLEHQKQLKAKWKKFTESQDPSFQSRNVDDANINEVIGEILEKCR